MVQGTGLGVIQENRRMKKEIEVFGVTYDRYVLLQLQKRMTEELALKQVVEMPSHGAKAAGSLYSIGFGLADCHVTLVNPEIEMMYGWEELGIRNKSETASDVNVFQTGFADGQFDMAWNFVTWTELEDPPAYLKEMKRISNRYVLLVTCNNFQPGYPWHRFLHVIYGFPWTHGQVKYNHMITVRRMFRDAGLNVIEYGAIDTPAEMELISRSLRDQVVWLRNHPSVFLWVLASDVLPRPELENRYLVELAEVDPTRPSLASCGSATSEVSGPTGVKMNGPYQWVPPNYWFLDRERGGAFGFNTETGPGPQPPPIESIRRWPTARCSRRSRSPLRHRR